jgi:hypothetical protein
MDPKLFLIKGIVSRDWKGLQMFSLVKGVAAGPVKKALY